MSGFPLKPRHYKQVEGLVRRTQGDVSQNFMKARAMVTPFALDVMEARPAKPRLVSTAQGRLEQMLLTIPSYAVRSEALATVYTDLLAKLPGTLSLVVLTHESVQSDVSGWIKTAKRDAGSRVVAIPDHLHFSIWAEDGYVVTQDQSTQATYFVEPFSFPRYADSLIADFVSNATELKKTQAPLYFQGGNVLIGDDFFMIGADYPANSLQYIGNVLVPKPGESRVQLIRRLYSEYLDSSRQLIYVASTIPVPAETSRQVKINGETWTEVLYTGNHEGTSQPLFHIDMFITLAGRGQDGRYRVLVGDPKAAADALGQPLQPHAMQPVFDNIAHGLKKAGFEVSRNPLPLVYVDDPDRRERVWYFATANNALVQIPSQGQPEVWLPSYGHGDWKALAQTDQMNLAIWEKLGFKATLLGDFHPFAENLGAVHCIKKYLARS